MERLLFPRKYARFSVICYLLSLAAVSILFSGSTMKLNMYIFGFVSVYFFFYGTTYLSSKWSRYDDTRYKRSLFTAAFVIRALYVVFIFIFNTKTYGLPFESNPADIGWYMETGEYAAQMVRDGDFNVIQTFISWGIVLDDIGYVLWLGIVYLLSFHISPVLIPLIIKALLGSATCIFAYNIARRHFGDGIGKMTGIFCMLQFNMIWWCGSMMKETEMVFFTFLFLNFVDKLTFGVRKFKLSFKLAVLVSLSILPLFLFRMILGIMALAAFIGTIVFTSDRIISKNKKIIASAVMVAVLAVAFGDTISAEFNKMTERAFHSDFQEMNMEWRATRAGGNEFAKYAGAAVFAPFIFTLPFPTMAYTQFDQEMLMQVNGGNFTKNVLSFFVILTLFSMLPKKRWKEHVLPIAFTCGYLLALVLSEFAQSGRFHMPIIPFEMMFAAYGITLMEKYKHKQWFRYALVLEFAICIGWNWFKLAGRGMI